MKRVAFALVLFGGLCLPMASASGQTLKKIYLVVDITGKVLAWLPSDVEWKVLQKGARLPESTLIQVTEGSTFSFEMNSRNGFHGLRAESARIKINRPMIIRL